MNEPDVPVILLIDRSRSGDGKQQSRPQYPAAVFFRDIHQMTLR